MGLSSLLFHCLALWLGVVLPLQFHVVASFSLSPAATVSSGKLWSDRAKSLVLQSNFEDGDFGSRKDDEDDSEEEDLITKEQFYRDLMGLSNEDNIRAEHNKPKKKNKSAKQARQVNHDNRDQLPFLVQVITPPDKAYEKELAKQIKKKNKKKKNGGSPSTSDPETVTETLGEFSFDKSTNSGDKIEIDNEVYLVQRSKCQYRYAGAQKFVMVRKILQVKPIQRAMQEDYLKRQWNAPPAPDIL